MCSSLSNFAQTDKRRRVSRPELKHVLHENAPDRASPVGPHSLRSATAGADANVTGRRIISNNCSVGRRPDTGRNPAKSHHAAVLAAACRRRGAAGRGVCRSGCRSQQYTVDAADGSQSSNQRGDDHHKTVWSCLSVHVPPATFA